MVAPAAAAAVRAGAARASSTRATTAAAVAGVSPPARTRRVESGAASTPVTPRRSKRAHGLGGGAITGGPRYVRMLKAEWVLCMVILALSPLADPEGEEGAGAAFKRCAACTGVFFLLGLVATGGPKAAKAAAGFGGLVTVALVLSSRDVFGAVAARVQAGFTGGAQSGDLGAATGSAAAGAANAIGDQFGGGGPDGGSQPFTNNGAPIQLPPGMQP